MRCSLWNKDGECRVFSDVAEIFINPYDTILRFADGKRRKFKKIDWEVQKVMEG